MKNETDLKISAYLRLAELCGTGDESKKKYYMEKVESLLSQHEESLEDVFLHYVDGFSLDLIRMFTVSDFISMFENENHLSLCDSDYKKIKYIICRIVGDDYERTL